MTVVLLMVALAIQSTILATSTVRVCLALNASSAAVPGLADAVPSTGVTVAFFLVALVVETTIVRAFSVGVTGTIIGALVADQSVFVAASCAALIVVSAGYANFVFLDALAPEHNVRAVLIVGALGVIGSIDVGGALLAREEIAAIA